MGSAMSDRERLGVHMLGTPSLPQLGYPYKELSAGVAAGADRVWLDRMSAGVLIDVDAPW